MQSHTTDSPTFACLKLSDALLTNLKRLGFTEPTPIQTQAIPPAIEGCDLIGIAQTGTGKTFAFGLPMLDRLLNTNEVGLILAPTRELAIQIDEELKKLASSLGLKTAVLIGGAPMHKQVQDLRRRPNIIIATPGRLKDHMYQRTMGLRNVSVVVLDEADRMFDMGFAPAVRAILDQTPADRQTLLFSATMPAEIVDLVQEYLSEPVTIEIAPQGTPSELVDQEAHVIAHENKYDLMADVLDTYTGTVLVFSRTRHGARKVALAIRGMGHSAAELHSDRTLAQRKMALQGFKNGEYRVLVATDIAARGIDVKDIELVVNYDLPDHLEDYIHRIGRTGRAGSLGKAITFTLPNQVRDIRKLEKIIGREILLVENGAPVKRERPATPKRFERPRNEAKPRKSEFHSKLEKTYAPQEDAPQTRKSGYRDGSGPRNGEVRNDNPRFESRDNRGYSKPKWEGRCNDRPLNRDERPARPFNRDNRADRPARPFNRDERPARPFNGGNREDRPSRPFNGGNRDDRPARPFNRDERPARPFNGGNRDDRPAKSFERKDWQDRKPNTNRFDKPAFGDRQDKPPFEGRGSFQPKDRTNKPRWEDRSKNTQRPGKPFQPRSESVSPDAKPGRPKPSGTPKQFNKKPGQAFVKNPKSAPGKKFGRK